MTLRLDDRWVWDFWFAQEGDAYHIFYLQAPRALKEEGLRHWNVSVGHAVSTDLRCWDILPDALAPSVDTAWDDYTTWTGSVLQHDGIWHMFYTGSSKQENGLRQRIGLATSDDLMTWHRHPISPVSASDGIMYETLSDQMWHDESWRDPWVFFEPTDARFHAFITARSRIGPADSRGVIAHCSSADLMRWQLHPPVVTRSEFGVLEVPQLVHIGDWYYLLFSTYGQVNSARWLETHASVTGTHYLMSPYPFGPFESPGDAFLLGDEHGTYYSGKLVQNPHGDWVMMAFRNLTADGTFIGEICDPMPLHVLPSGHLKLG